MPYRCQFWTGTPRASRTPPGVSLLRDRSVSCLRRSSMSHSGSPLAADRWRAPDHITLGAARAVVNLLDALLFGGALLLRTGGGHADAVVLFLEKVHWTCARIDPDKIAIPYPYGLIASGSCFQSTTRCWDFRYLCFQRFVCINCCIFTWPHCGSNGNLRSQRWGYRGT